MPGFKYAVLVGMAGLFLLGCSGEEDDSREIKVSPITVPDSQKSKESGSVKETYLQAVLEARASGRDCGHYEKDDDGNYVLDENGSRITIRDGSSEDWFPKVENDALAWNDELYLAAYEHSQDMPSMGKDVTHEGSGGPTDHTAEVNHPGEPSTFDERVKTNGYTYALLFENLTVGTDTDTPEKAVDAWLNSAGHCKDLMNQEVTDMGMSHVEVPESHYIHYWTLELAKPATEPSGIY